MIVTLVHVWVKLGKEEEFIRATTENHKNSVNEPGNLRFDLLRDSNDSTKFVIYEAFLSEEAVAAHKETEHYLRWREAVADIMAKSRKGERHEVICPTDKSEW